VSTGRFAKLTYTPSVLAVQQKMGSNAANRLRFSPDEREALTEYEADFIAERDSFYMATVNEDGWPYIQHRGGPAGFLHILDEHTLAFADVSGNRQYVSTGNLASDDRVALFLMDYPHRTRLKILAHATVTPWSEAPEELRQLLPLGASGRPERVFTLHVEAFDWNCSQGITPRWTSDEILDSAVGQRLAEMQRDNDRLRKELAALKGASLHPSA
jgi:predicted pyridoxine 5'-phosphate oxidase superfamily flavin-nucleotide-binding protein